MPKVWRKRTIALPITSRVVVAFAITYSVQSAFFFPAIADSAKDGCIHSPNSQVRITRAQIEQLLQIQPPAADTAIVGIVGNVAYCQLSNVPHISGIPLRRYAYPCAFDPETWLILEFQGSEYIGFDFDLGNSHLLMYVKNYIHELVRSVS